ncbi:histone deacetylase [Plasmodium gonderi]|uniref:Histone deacetylase n=1 Tax=Plasmodium gonderi TaxID=77519 RepID=A0A1Y1JG37_PLAGO|nr:histone deacetylase [Plasmodium gonderi]GAW81489.1 histone deacetylase [Plasmodium gonderi]
MCDSKYSTLTTMVHAIVNFLLFIPILIRTLYKCKHFLHENNSPIVLDPLRYSRCMWKKGYEKMIKGRGTPVCALSYLGMQKGKNCVIKKNYVHKMEFYKNKTELSKNKTELSKNKTELSKNKTELSKNKTGLPKNKTGLPKNKTGLPKNKTELPKNKTGLSKNKIGFPKNKTELPKKKIELLIDKFVHECDKNRTNLSEKTFVKNHDILVNFERIQNEVNKMSQLALLRKEKLGNLQTRQKKYSILSQNPPYVFHPIYSSVSMKDKHHRFKIKKYENIFTQLNEKGIYNSDYFIPTCDINDMIIPLFKVHDEKFISEMLAIVVNNEQIEKFELALCPDLLCRFLIEINGTILSSLLALKYFMCMHIGGGNHHSKKSGGNGFCIFNDVAIAVHFLLSNGLIDKAIILDVDVHQGDGTAEIFRNYTNVKTISLHCKENFPPVKENSTVDVEFDSFIKDDAYLEAYKNVLDNIQSEQNCIIFYLSGVDISEDDNLGLLSISDNGIYKRDHMTYEMTIQKKIPVVTVLSGGYNECERTLASKHLLTFRAAKESWISRKK